MTSPHIISFFEFIVLQHSVRASGHPDFQRLQNIARLHPRHYNENPALIDELKDLIGRACTFVDDWSSSKITPSTCRLYGKKSLQRKLQKISLFKFKIHCLQMIFKLVIQEIFKIFKISIKSGKQH